MPNTLILSPGGKPVPEGTTALAVWHWGPEPVYAAIVQMVADHHAGASTLDEIRILCQEAIRAAKSPK